MSKLNVLTLLIAIVYIGVVNANPRPRDNLVPASHFEGQGKSDPNGQGKVSDSQERPNSLKLVSR